MKVRGTQSLSPNEIEVNIDTVYVRTNIKRIETEDFTGWEYDETQYGKDDYIAKIAEANSELEMKNTDLMLAIAEIAEASEVEKTATQLAIAELAELIAGGI